MFSDESARINARFFLMSLGKLIIFLALVLPQFAVRYATIYNSFGAWNDTHLGPAFRFMNLSLTLESPEIQRFSTLAKDLNIAIGISFLHRCDEAHARTGCAPECALTIA